MPNDSQIRRYGNGNAYVAFEAMLARSGPAIRATRRGIAVAVVVSLREFARLRGERAAFGEAYKRFLTTHAPGDVGLDEGFLNVTRETAAGRKVAL